MINRFAILLVLFPVCAATLVAAETLQFTTLRLPAEAHGVRSGKDSPAEWFERLLAFPYTNATPNEPGLQLVRQDFEQLEPKQLLDRYRAIRQLLVGAWYPLLPYTRSPRDWMAMQFHRSDLGEGMILVFRHAESPYRTVEVALRGLRSEQNYTLTFDSSGEKRRALGADLMRGLLLSLGTRPGSELITYREIQD